MDHQRREAKLARFAALIATTLLAACSSSSSGAPSGDPQFRRDVVPIFQARCATAVGCHGPADANTHYDANDPTALHAVLLGDSRTAPGVKLVAPGDPTASFLYAKLNGDEGNFEAQCTNARCGDTMPPGTKINTTDRETIRSWIALGAKDD